jgi:outer membrane protein
MREVSLLIGCGGVGVPVAARQTASGVKPGAPQRDPFIGLVRGADRNPRGVGRSRSARRPLFWRRASERVGAHRVDLIRRCRRDTGTGAARAPRRCRTQRSWRRPATHRRMQASSLFNDHTMQRILALALFGIGGLACAQTPPSYPMPDGSRDLYAGLGLVTAPRWDGAASSRRALRPVLQLHWSNGVFVSGMSAGMHLSAEPSIEFGPLLGYQRGRDTGGNGAVIGGVNDGALAIGGNAPPGLIGPPGANKSKYTGSDRLVGIEPIGARLEWGGFFNYYLTPQLRLTNSVLLGSGRARDGARWSLGLQRIATEIAPHHTLAFDASLTLANAHANEDWFGVTATESARSINRRYLAAGGLRDAALGARWNWALTPAWLLTSRLQATHLLGAAKDSPLVERPTGLSLSSALALRF